MTFSIHFPAISPKLFPKTSSSTPPMKMIFPKKLFLSKMTLTSMAVTRRGRKISKKRFTVSPAKNPFSILKLYTLLKGYRAGATFFLAFSGLTFVTLWMLFQKRSNKDLTFLDWLDGLMGKLTSLMDYVGFLISFWAALTGKR